MMGIIIELAFYHIVGWFGWFGFVLVLFGLVCFWLGWVGLGWLVCWLVGWLVG